MKKPKNHKKPWISKDDNALDILIKNHIPTNNFGNDSKINKKLINSIIGKHNSKKTSDLVNHWASTFYRTNTAVYARIEKKLHDQGFQIDLKYFYRKKLKS